RPSRTVSEQVSMARRGSTSARTSARRRTLAKQGAGRNSASSMSPTSGSFVVNRILRPCFFFFQAEDGIRDGHVTGVQTCALPISAAARPNPGRPVLHRLNRAEYANAVRDLLALDVDASTLLPPDDSAYGFDNVGDV